MLSLSGDLARRMARFAVVGATGFLIDFSITALIYGWAGMYVATGIGFSIAATSNYLLNRRWTWRSQNPNVKTEFVKFYMVSLIGLGIHYVVLMGCMTQSWLMLSVAGWQINNDWTSKLVATAVVMVWNFLANNFYTFKHK